MAAISFKSSFFIDSFDYCYEITFSVCFASGWCWWKFVCGIKSSVWMLQHWDEFFSFLPVICIYYLAIWCFLCSKYFSPPPDHRNQTFYVCVTKEDVPDSNFMADFWIFWFLLDSDLKINNVFVFLLVLWVVIYFRWSVITMCVNKILNA